ncbi:MAG: hypothetical protein KF846_03675 [Cyclobacteriaceae bacterium]|nr:hypothetical protein [Cyclobacteriaceae bacterium]
MKSKIFYALFLIVVTFILLEVTLRLTSTQKGHVTYLFGKKSYYLAPLDVPEEFPDINQQTDGYGIYDADVGWSYKSWGSAVPLYYANREGIRCSKDDYERGVADSTLRDTTAYTITCIGDSFTHGDEVLFEQAWPYYLEQETKAPVLNLGVGGYGIDQATLRYIKFSPKSKIVLLGLITGDFERACTQIYGLSGGGLKTKPIFEFTGDSVTVKNIPALHGNALKSEFQNPGHSAFFAREAGYPALFVKRWPDHFYVIRVLKTLSIWRNARKPIYKTDDSRLTYCLNILSYLNDKVKENDAELYIVLLDNLNTFEDWKKGEGDPWALLKNKFEERKLRYVSMDRLMFDQYQQTPDSIINKGMVHYTPHANLLVARWLSEKEFVKQATLN